MSAPTFTNDEQQYGTHWHLRIQGVDNVLITAMRAKFKEVVELHQFEYCSAGVERTFTDEGEECKHIHAAIGTKKSVKKWFIVNKLGLNQEFKENHTNWYCRPIYPSSSPAANAEYCTKGEYYELDFYFQFFIHEIQNWSSDETMDLTMDSDTDWEGDEDMHANTLDTFGINIE